MKANCKPISCESCYICTPRHKLFAWIALIGIFLCGMMLGATLWGQEAHTADSGQKGLVTSVKEAVEAKVMPCQVKEDALLQMITENDHVYNVRVYERLGKIGCDRNKEKYANFAKSEQELADAVNYIKYNEVSPETGSEPCEVIEKTLSYRIHNDCGDFAECHSNNAEVYAKMAEDGCAKNKEFYTQKALNEIQIADGVRVKDNDLSKDEVTTTVNTYKKLQMQNEARKYIQKAEKLINPGVDFIMELQRVIEE